MTSEPDLAKRVTRLEELSSRQTRPGPARGLFAGLGGLVLVCLITLNLAVTWKSFDALASNRMEHHFWLLCHGGASDNQRRDALTALLQAGNREWRSARLANLKLQRADFDDVHLTWANLTGCDFTRSTMVRANLKGANLQMTKLVNVDLTEADLAEAYLLKADLSDATVRHAKLQSAMLDQSDLKNTDLTGSDLTEASLSLAVLTSANLQNANLSWSNLDAADLSKANLDGAIFDKAVLRDASFADSNWWRAAGLPTDVIEQFKQDFAPTSEAPQGFKEDYREWLSE